MKNFLYLIILTLYIILPFSVIEEPNTLCQKLDNYCIQSIRKELNITQPILILNDPTVNAWTNGVIINITTGMLEVPGMSTDAVKVILLHEQGHILNHSHSVRDLYWKAYQAEVFECGEDFECLDRAGVRFLKEMKEDEYRCDVLAIIKAHELKLDPEKACYAFKVFAEMSNYELDDIESTHPSSVDRYKKCVVGISTGIIPLK